MTAETPGSGEVRSLKWHAAIALGAILLLGGGFVTFAALTDIAGAVVASGTVVVESYPKRIQHQDGGTVQAILVRDDDTVATGELLLRLDDTTIRANVALAESQLTEAVVEQARLIAELDGQANFDAPLSFSSSDLNADSSRPVVDAQRRMLVAELTARDRRVSQLDEQISQIGSEIDGLALQKQASEQQLAIVTKELSALGTLSDQQVVLASKVNDLSKQQAAQQGEVGRLLAAEAQARATIAERRFQIEQINSDFTTQTLAALKSAREAEARARQQLVAEGSRLARTEVRAPQAGVVHESIVHTVGGVITAGETLMEIVPVSDTLIVEIHVDPTDIDKVQSGQKVRLRLTSFEARSTPEIAGTIQAVSPDYVQEQQQRPYYIATAQIDAAELRKLPQTAKLRPGMPVEGFVVTGQRSILSYLVHPFAEQLQLAFRED